MENKKTGLNKVSRIISRGIAALATALLMVATMYFSQRSTQKKTAYA